MRWYAGAVLLMLMPVANIHIGSCIAQWLGRIAMHRKGIVHTWGDGGKRMCEYTILCGLLTTMSGSLASRENVRCCEPIHMKFIISHAVVMDDGAHWFPPFSMRSAFTSD